MSFKFDLNKRFYKQVAASSVETSDYVPANGEKILIENLGASSSSVPDTIARIVWDAGGTPEILISSYGEVIHNGARIEKTGDGTKILRISLTNDLAEPAYLGGFWQGEILA